MDSNQPSDLGLHPFAPKQGDGASVTRTQGGASSPSAIPMPQALGQQTQHQPAEATDDVSEVLDQEWVNKAKDIVEKTKGDPFTQSKELSKVKAGYLKVRYNKELKVGEDSA